MTELNAFMIAWPIETASDPNDILRIKSQIKLLAPELIFFLILGQPVYKM